MKILFYSLLLLILISCLPKPDSNFFRPGEIWTDTGGNPINAHGGGILFHKSNYYWFGEIKKGKTWLVPTATVLTMSRAPLCCLFPGKQTNSFLWQTGGTRLICLIPGMSGCR